MYRLLNTITADPAIESCYPFGQYHHVVFKEIGNEQQHLKELTQQGNFTQVEINAIEPNIEDCFYGFDAIDKEDLGGNASPKSSPKERT